MSKSRLTARFLDVNAAIFRIVDHVIRLALLRLQVNHQLLDAGSIVPLCHKGGNSALLAVGNIPLRTAGLEVNCFLYLLRLLRGSLLDRLNTSGVFAGVAFLGRAMLNYSNLF